MSPPDHFTFTFGCSRKSLILQSRFWNRHGIEQSLDNVLGSYALGLRVEVGQNAMPENRVREGLNILYRNMVTPMNEGSRFAAQDQEL